MKIFLQVFNRLYTEWHSVPKSIFKEIKGFLIFLDYFKKLNIMGKTFSKFDESKNGILFMFFSIASIDFFSFSFTFFIGQTIHKSIFTIKFKTTNFI